MEANYYQFMYLFFLGSRLFPRGVLSMSFFLIQYVLLLLQFQIKAYLSFVDGTLVDKKDDNNSR